MTYVLDTNVVSLSSPIRRRDAPRFREWLNENEPQCFLSVVTLTEICYGIEKLRYTGATTKASALAGWYEALQERFSGRIIPVTVDIAEKSGEFILYAKYKGVEISSEDAYIGATAACNQFRVVTYNLKDLEPLPVCVSTPEQLLIGGSDV